MHIVNPDLQSNRLSCRVSRRSAKIRISRGGDRGCLPDHPPVRLEECSIRHKAWTVIDQNPQNSCCPSATAGAAMILREIAGEKRILLSQGSLYGQINGGRDDGANIEDALEAMMKTGVCPASAIDPQDWQGRGLAERLEGRRRKISAILEAFDCPTFDAAASAVQLSMPVVFGVYWGGGRSRHHGRRLEKIGGGWGLEFLNSWGADWGDGGFGVLPEAKCAGIETFGAFAIRCVTSRRRSIAAGDLAESGRKSKIGIFTPNKAMRHRGSSEQPAYRE